MEGFENYNDASPGVTKENGNGAAKEEDKTKDKALKSDDKDRSNDVDHRSKDRDRRSKDKDRRDDKLRPSSREKDKDRKDKRRDSRSRGRRSSSRGRKARRDKRSRSGGRRNRRKKSRSRTSSSSPSRSKSKEKDKKKKKESKFDSVALTQTMQMINQGQVPSDSLANASSVQMQSAFPQLTRQARRLYVGNLPTGMGLTEKMLTEFFNATVTSLGIKTPQPVLSCWLSSQGTFCFVEFRGCQDANVCMSLLQGITLGGRSLRVGRPADYKPPPPHLDNYIVGFPPGQTPPGAPSAPGQMDLMMGMGNMLGFSNMPLAGPAPGPGPATRVLLLENMVQESELKDDEEFKDILADVREECEKHGKVEQVVVPRPFQESKTEDVQGPRTGVGVGRIFVLFTEAESSMKAQQALNGRLFNENAVRASFYPESDYNNRIFGSPI